MSKEQLQGGKADNMSVKDIAKLHGVKTSAIEKEIRVGMSVEKEHTSSKAKQREISKDHVIEDDKYYTEPKTGLIVKEKEAEKRMNEERKKMKALAGIQEGDKKYLTNESFSEDQALSKNDANPDNWKGMDAMPNGNSPIQDPMFIGESEKEADSNFIVKEFDQIEVAPGEDDEKLYKLG